MKGPEVGSWGWMEGAVTGQLLVPLSLLGREKLLTEGAHSIQLALTSPALPKS